MICAICGNILIVCMSISDLLLFSFFFFDLNRRLSEWFFILFWLLIGCLYHLWKTLVWIRLVRRVESLQRPSPSSASAAHLCPRETQKTVSYSEVLPPDEQEHTVNMWARIMVETHSFDETLSVVSRNTCSLLCIIKYTERHTDLQWEENGFSVGDEGGKGVGTEVLAKGR